MCGKNRRAAALLLLAMLLASLLLTACSTGESGPPDGDLGNGWLPTHSLELRYAENFRVDYYAGGYALLALLDGSRYLVVPEGATIPADLDESIRVLQQPVDNIYLVATSAMGLFDALDALDHIGLSGTAADGWTIAGARAAMEAGAIRYAGKYSAPDYELILSSGCGLAVQSTMIRHTPEVQEKLEELGVTVLVDQSSYEPHPLGRTEWLKLYAVLVDAEERAARLFDEQAAYLDEVADLESTGQTVAFFYISSSGTAVVRRPGDYVSRMIELAGGEYVFHSLGDADSALGTVHLELEEFYAAARDADVLIYNSTVGGELSSLDELLAKSPLLADFKAVREGNVWCTGKNLFQDTTQLGLMIADFRRLLTASGDGPQELTFLYQLQ